MMFFVFMRMQALPQEKLLELFPLLHGQSEGGYGPVASIFRLGMDLRLDMVEFCLLPLTVNVCVLQ